MNSKFDRTLIAPLLVPHFPHMAKATSDEWNAFLDGVTRMDTPFSMRNGTAFDRWRGKLAEMGYPVGIDADRAAKAKADAARLLATAETRAADLAELAKEAPNRTAAELMADYTKALDR